MHPDLEKLIRLQELEDELRTESDRLADIPIQRAAADAQLAEERVRLEEARSALEGCQRERRQQEGHLQDFETKRSRFKTQLMDVKTNKEYTAVLHEIEIVDREVSKCEDLILAEMERVDALADRVKQEEGAVQECEERHASEVHELDALRTTLEGEAEKLRKERDAVFAELPEDVRELFQRVAKSRGGAVAEAKDGVCLQCRVKLRLQFYVEVKRNEAIRQCENCSRILYHAAPVPEVSPLP